MGVGFEEVGWVGYVVDVLLVGVVGDGGGFGVVDVVLEREVEVGVGNVLGGEWEVGGREGIEVFNEVEEGDDGREVGVGREVIGRVGNNVGGVVDGGEIVVGDGDGRIGVVVVEEEVVCWVVFFYEVIVEEEGMVLGVE